MMKNCGIRINEEQQKIVKQECEKRRWSKARFLEFCIEIGMKEIWKNNNMLVKKKNVWFINEGATK